MSPEQAKEVLLLYRPGVFDESETEVAEALVLASKDRALKQWFDGHCALQIKLRAEFHRISVPEGLREQILSERPVLVAPGSNPQKKWAIGALLVLVLLGGILLFRPQTESRVGDLETYRHRMTGMVVRAYPRMDIYTNDVEVIRRYLVQNDAPAQFSLSDALLKTPGTGGKVLSWRNHKVSMVCFRSGKMPGPEPDLFLFVIDQNAFVEKNKSTPPILVRQGSLLSATWSDRGQTYLLATTVDEGFLKQYF
jgi:hypothetical protein